MRYAGEFAALGTAACWSVSSNLFVVAGRRMGPDVLNRLRITAAAVFLGGTLLVLRGSPWPNWATGSQVALLAASGVIGFVFGDNWYFRSLVSLGAGRAALLASLAPLFTAILGWPVLGEIPGPLALLGMALTLGGIFWVLIEREHEERAHGGTVAGREGVGGPGTAVPLRSGAAGPVEVTPAGPPSAVGPAAGTDPPRSRARGRTRALLTAGVIAGVLAAVGQAVGYVISKLALRTGIDPLSATVVRVVAAVVGIWALAFAQGAARSSLAPLRDRRATLFMVGGAIGGPFLGVTLSLAALQYIQAGVAASITAIYPVLTFLIAARFHGEPLTVQTMAGTLVAVAGVIVLFLR
jgi:drug/metabolite transporter (DMT)-like permease